MKQLQKMWRLTDKEPEYLKLLESLTAEDIKSVPEGNKKATFIPMMSEGERDDFVRNNEPFWKKINAKLKEIVK